MTMPLYIIFFVYTSFSSPSLFSFLSYLPSFYFAFLFSYLHHNSSIPHILCFFRHHFLPSHQHLSDSPNFLMYIISVKVHTRLPEYMSFHLYLHGGFGYEQCYFCLFACFVGHIIRQILLCKYMYICFIMVTVITIIIRIINFIIVFISMMLFYHCYYCSC